MKLVAIVITFILSAQLAYANATVCDNFGKCGQAVTSEKSQMKDCPFHSSQNQKKEKKQETKSQCKCCAVLMLETSMTARPSLEQVLSFIDFEYLESSTQVQISASFRPPIT